MAIVFNSDAGTISGLSVGGLPDGIVDGDTLANNAVVTGKIADGTIANADVNDLAASKLTGALPAISGAALTGIAATGTIKQIVTGTTNTAKIVQSDTYIDSLLTANITPTAASSKIIVMASCSNMEKDAGNANTSIKYRLLRDSTAIATTNYHGQTGVNASAVFNGPHLNWIDSPNTTSQITYKTQAASTSGYGNAYVNYGGTSLIILIEVSQ
jgi:hypothetical protein